MLKHLALLTSFIITGLCGQVAAQDLESQLKTEGTVALAKAAAAQGDAQRGAVVFYQQYMACTKCHLAGDKPSPLGPDLSKIGKQATNENLIESILDPAKVIKQEFVPVTVETDEGKSIVGLLAEETKDMLVLRDPSRDGKLIKIPKDSIDVRVAEKLSIMPSGQVNSLASRQQFLDLVRYLIEIRDGGPAKALALEPPPALYAARPLPEYEKNIDHAGMISSLDSSSLKRGAAIYERVCANCHGTVDKPGSLPNSL
ncbi:MAG: cytochrome c1, partial [Aeoliella sp.]